MADRPVIFSAPMVRALLAGRKTQTRRLIRNMPEAPSHESVVHPNPKHDAPYFDAYCGKPKTPANPRGMSDYWCWWTRDDREGRGLRIGYAPGDRLYVREAHHRTDDSDDSHLVGYDATPDVFFEPYYHDIDGVGRVGFFSHSLGGWGGRTSRNYPSIHMPRWASRLTLTVEDVRVERLQAISEADAQAEGAEKLIWDGEGHWHQSDAGTFRCGFAGIWQHLHGAESWDANPWVVALTFSVQHGNIDRLPS